MNLRHSSDERPEHAAFASYSEDGYHGACHGCDWTGPLYGLGMENKRRAREDALAHAKEADPFRYCRWCDADCAEDETQHTADCPSSTGVFPVEYEACHPPCQHCGKRPDPSIRCSECECVLGLGDYYTHRQVGDYVGTPTYEPVCLGCAALEAAG